MLITNSKILPAEVVQYSPVWLRQVLYERFISDVFHELQKKIQVEKHPIEEGEFEGGKEIVFSVLSIIGQKKIERTREIFTELDKVFTECENKLALGLLMELHSILHTE